MPRYPLPGPGREKAEGQDVACYDVDGLALDAGDVAGAAVRQDRSIGPGRWGLTLTEAATARLAGLVGDVGPGASRPSSSTSRSPLRGST